MSEVVIPKEFQGFVYVVHGGILGTLLDELMANLYWLKGIKAVTAEYQVRLKKSLPGQLKSLSLCLEFREMKKDFFDRFSGPSG